MRYNLYTENEIKEKQHRGEVYLESYITGEGKPFVIVCPGGAYRFVSNSNEGEPFAKKLNERGYNAFVLYYSVGIGKALCPNPVLDLARAVEFIKTSDEFKTAESFALMGSSAGGHLCAYFGAKYKEFEKDVSLEPSAITLAYPVITMGDYTHKVTRQHFLGFFSSKVERDNASVEKLVTADYPPTFTWHNKDDASVDYRNSVMLKEKLDSYNVPCELKLYENGGHGIGLAEGYEAEGWIDKAIDFIDKYI